MFCDSRSVFLLSLGPRLLELTVDFTHFTLAGLKVLLLLLCEILKGSLPDKAVDSILTGPPSILKGGVRISTNRVPGKMSNYII